jgi:asparagine synthase (glutamine-hydrolysing)
MCGIAGFIDSNTSVAERAAAVERMCSVMRHRGPDDGGLEAPGEATLGMRRLAIFDPTNGHQPMRTADGRFTLVFNGAIYNFRELRAELHGAGWPFRTDCDTEVLLAAYAQWGERCLDRLRGMFAFAVWDAQEKRLFLARDPFGIKPLYFRAHGGQLLFASEVTALLAARAFTPEIDPASVGDYLSWFAVPAPRTIYRGVLSLRPGECAIWEGGRLTVRAAWSFRAIAPEASPCASREEFIRELRARLEDSIRAHLLADVPVGAFLSGGLDSAVIVGLMARGSPTRLRTFSIGFDEAGYSEAAEAEAAARHFGTEHHARVLTGREVAGDIERLMAAYDQPTGDGINTYYVSQAAHAGGVKVALSGLGGDELFGGYPSFCNLQRLPAWLRRWRRLPKAAQRLVLGRLRRGDTRRRKLADLLSHARDIHELASMQRLVFSGSGRRSLLAPEVLEAGGGHTAFHPELASLKAELDRTGPFGIASAWELRTYMADVLLRDSDVMSMRHSLELRVPFVDRPLIEWLWRQPEAYRYTPRRPKDALAEATADLLPPGLRSRRKRGFALPFGVWMKGALEPFLDETFSDSSIGRSGLFQRAPVQALWRNFLRNDDTREWSRLWSLAVLIAFANRRTSIPAAAAPAPITVLSPPARTAARAVAPVAPAAPPPAVPVAAPRPAPVPPPSPPAALPNPAPPATPRARPARPCPPVPPTPAASLPPAPATPRPPRYQRFTTLLAPEIFASMGGIPRILQLYLKALCELGAERNEGVRLVALNDSVLDSTDLRRYANGNLENWYVASRHKARFVKAALRMIRGCDQVICGHVAQLPVALAARVLHPRLRYYLVAHGIEVWRPFSLAERLALRGATRVFCVSEYTRGQLLKHCPLRPDRVIVVPNALDPFFAAVAPAPLADRPPVILTATRLSYADRYKGVEHLIAAMPAVLAAEPAARLRVVGQGDDLPRLQSLARKQGNLGTTIEFLGGIDDKRLVQELRDCRLFALPSEKEGFGLVFLEAMGQARPCLGARAGGVPEVITEATGVLVEFGNVPAIAAGCIEGLRRPWSEAALLARADLFSYQHFKERLGLLLPP